MRDERLDLGAPHQRAHGVCLIGGGYPLHVCKGSAVIVQGRTDQGAGIQHLGTDGAGLNTCHALIHGVQCFLGAAQAQVNTCEAVP